MPENEPIIVAAEICPQRNLSANGNVVVMCELDNGDIVDGPSWYNDELNLTPAIFIGKTVTQAFRIKQGADIRYLQS